MVFNTKYQDTRHVKLICLDVLKILHIEFKINVLAASAYIGIICTNEKIN